MTMEGWSFEARVLRRFLIVLAGFILLIIVGVATYRWLEEMEPFDALYMTIITISTVGFGEVKPLSPSGRLVTIGLIIGGAGLAAYTASIAADLLASEEWRVL